MQSSFQQYVSMYVTGQKAGAPLGKMQPGVLVKAGEGTYLGSRGGDYSGIAVDTVNDTFWAANEYSRSSFDLWGTWVANFTITSASARRSARLPPPHDQDGAGTDTAPAHDGLDDSGGNTDASLTGLLPGDVGSDGEQGAFEARLRPGEPDLLFSISSAGLFRLPAAEWPLFSGLDS